MSRANDHCSFADICFSVSKYGATSAFLSLSTVRVLVQDKTYLAASHTFNRTSWSSGQGRFSNLVAPPSDLGMQARCDRSKVCPAGTHAAAWVLTPGAERLQQRMLVGHRQRGRWRP